MKALRAFCKYRGIAAYLAVLAIIALPLFGHLDEIPIQVWDEMRNAQNALEMNHTGRLIVTTYDYAPETWNTKPPLLIWILAISQRVLGYNELAVRLPSAIAAALTCLLILRFAKRRTGKWLPGIIAVIMLVTISPYVAVHGVRTGDYEALLVLCITASLFWLCNYVEEENPRWLWLSAAALTAAVLTKGVSGLFGCPAMLAYVLLRGKARLLFREKAFYGCLTGFIILVGGYYGARELQQPGYLHAVAVNELGGRYGNVLEGEQGDFWTYCNTLIGGFRPWTLLVIPAVCAGILTRRRRWRHVAILCGLMSSTVLLILSFSSTKLWWYLMPLYPALALLCGLFAHQLMMLIGRWRAPAQIWRFNFLPLLILLAVAAVPYKEVLDRTVGDDIPKRNPAVHDVGIYLKEVIAGKRRLGGNVLCGRYILPFRWYESVAQQQGLALQERDVKALHGGDNVLTWDPETADYIHQHYFQTESEVFRSLVIFHVDSARRAATDTVTGAMKQ